MKKIFFVLWLLFPIFGFSYQQQGFWEYQEEFWTTRFSCQGQCIILIGETDTYDMLNIEWTINGKWILWFGFLVGQQVIPGSLIEINWDKPINQQFIFSESPTFTKIPEKTKLVVIMEGELQGKTKISPDIITIGQKISKWWKDFWNFDTFKPYTINLLKWPTILGESANKIFYILIIVIIIYIFIFNRKSIKQKITYTWLCLICFRWIYEIRMGMENINYYRQDYIQYISKTKYNKTYRDRGDFYSFVDFVKDKLSILWVPKNEKISFFCDNDRPFPDSIKYLLYPYDIQRNNEENKYFIIYNYQNIKKENNEIIINNKSIWSWKIYEFSPYAFIFIK